MRKWWSIHGLALNVRPDLNHFGLIIPCGIRDRGVCSMEKLLGDRTPATTEVRDALAAELTAVLGFSQSVFSDAGALE